MVRSFLVIALLIIYGVARDEFSVLPYFSIFITIRMSHYSIAMFDAQFPTPIVNCSISFFQKALALIFTFFKLSFIAISISPNHLT